MNTVSSRWSLRLLAVVLGSGLVFTACDDSDDDDDDQVAEKQPEKEKVAKDEKAVKEDPAKAEEEEDRLSYSYNPIGKRDPFKSFISEKESLPKDVQPETPLQKFELDQYKLKAIVMGGELPVAMVEDPTGMGFFLQKDTYIGKNWGKVVRITPSEVIVAEEYRDFEGKLIVNEIPLRLPQDKELDVAAR